METRLHLRMLREQVPGPCERIGCGSHGLRGRESSLHREPECRSCRSRHPARLPPAAAYSADRHCPARLPAFTNHRVDNLLQLLFSLLKPFHPGQRKLLQKIGKRQQHGVEHHRDWAVSAHAVMLVAYPAILWRWKPAAPVFFGAGETALHSSGGPLRLPIWHAASSCFS